MVLVVINGHIYGWIFQHQICWTVPRFLGWNSSHLRLVDYSWWYVSASGKNIWNLCTSKTRITSFILFLKFQTYTVKHFLARALCLIALPVALYVAIFYVHLRILHLGGEEDEFYSSAFQVSLKGNMFHNSTGPRGILNWFYFLLVYSILSKIYFV